MARSLDRMEASRDSTVDFQDHLWSFLYAFRVVAYYLARYQCEAQQAGEEFKMKRGDAVQRWTSSLSSREKVAWDYFTSKRNEDTHVRPVKASWGTNPWDGEETWDNNAVWRNDSYVVTDGPARYEAVLLCRRGLAVARRFVADVPRIVAESKKS